MAQRSPGNRPTVACSQTLYFLFRDRRARVLTQKPPGIYWPLAKRGWCGGKDCLVPRSHDCARPMRFGSRGPSEPFVSDTSSKCIDRGTRQWKRALDFLLISRAAPLFSRSRSLASFACSSIVEKKKKTTYLYRLDQQFLLCLTAGFTNLNASQSLVGYLQVSGLKFYRDLCPPEKRNEWLSNFASKQDYKVHTWLTKIKTTMPVKGSD